MNEIKEHPIKNIEVSIIKFNENGTTKYKVTRRVPEMGVAETKMLSSLEKANQQAKEWLSE